MLIFSVYIYTVLGAFFTVDILNNLHKEFGKTVRVVIHDHRCHVELLQCITRVLEQLASSGKIKEKVYGKQKVYVVDQVPDLYLLLCML